MYRAEPLYNSLQLSLGDAAIFGGARGNKSRRIHDTKVAVTSTDEFARNAIINANYNRQGKDYAHHLFRRPQNPEEELKLWEAAAASAAAPPYFPPFHDAKIDRDYLDGAFYNNNPARVAYREAQLLWHDVSRLPPDVLVSIGTGKQDDTDEQTDRQWQLQKSAPSAEGALERQGDVDFQP
jgi:patatin-like phospholipase/acyl hydrolase